MKFADRFALQFAGLTEQQIRAAAKRAGIEMRQIDVGAWVVTGGKRRTYHDSKAKAFARLSRLLLQHAERHAPRGKGR